MTLEQASASVDKWALSSVEGESALSCPAMKLCFSFKSELQYLMKEQAASSQVENHFLIVTTLLWKKIDLLSGGDCGRERHHCNLR